MKLNYEETIKKVSNKFGCGAEVEGIASNIFARFDEFEDFYTELINCADTELIYTEDQWSIIQYYISPDTIGNMHYVEIEELFIEDLHECGVYE